MYGKVFDSMYEGTLYGHWEAIVTLQQFIVLADADGVVDMTPQAIAARTSIPLDILTKGIGVLSEPDPYTRTPGEEGRRIILMDSHRPWGWLIVNHAKYKAMRDMEQKREADRVRIAEKRKKNKDVAIGSQSVAEVAHTDTDTDTEKLFTTFWDSYPKKVAKQEALKAFKKLSPSQEDFQRISAALEISKRCAQWVQDEGKFIPHASTWLTNRRFEDEAHAAPSIKVDV